MLTVESIVTHLPSQLTSIGDSALHLPSTPRQLEVMARYQKLKTVALHSDGLIENLSTVLRQMGQQVRTQGVYVDLILYCHTVISNTPFDAHLLTQVKRAAGFDATPALSITMNHCATGLTTLQTVERLLRTKKYRNVIILAGEKCFHESVTWIYPTTIMGEGVCAVWLTQHRSGNYEVLDQSSVYLGEFSLPKEQLSAQTLKDWDDRYCPTFSALLERLLDRNQLTIDDVRQIVPHNVNRTAIRRMAHQLRWPDEKFFLDNIETLGHCFCADPFINLQTYQNLSPLISGEYLLLMSGGLGATLNATLLRKQTPPTEVTDANS